MTQHFGFPLLDIIVLASVLILSIFIDFVGHKDGKEIGIKSALAWSGFWIALALSYYAFIWLEYGKDFASLFLAGYALEKSLSVDNLIVFLAIFSSFGIKTTSLQHKILLWGIAGAIFFRAIFVGLGTAAFNIHWVVPVVFGLLIIYSAYTIFKGIVKGEDEEDVDYSKHWVVKYVGKILPVSQSLDGNKFITVVNGIKMATPALLCVAVVELTDVMFSLDSIPAVISVSQEPLIIYSAMLFAILGLRALFFVLSVAIKYLVHLEKAVAVLLVFVGGKLIVAPFGYHIDANTSLYIVLGLLAAGVIASLLFPAKDEEENLPTT